MDRRSSSTLSSERLTLDDVLACPRCKHRISADSFVCTGCGHGNAVNNYGFAELVADDAVTSVDVIDTDYAADQHDAESGLYARYLKPYLAAVAPSAVVDVGCGVGRAVTLMACDGYEAFGVDVPAVARLWADYENDPRRFVCGDATALPFRDGVFDLAISRGVIEHIGTSIGHYTLDSDFRLQRRRFAEELLRVLKPGGRALVACPNKAFPVDIQHAPSDGLARVHPLREYVFARTGVNLHRTWGAYHLLSFPELRSLFLEAGARSVAPLPVRDYFAFGRFQRGALKPLGTAATAYVNHLPRALWRTALNPYVIGEIRA
ncbi:MAG: class I SAM-dependent methyltransferase [Candidatus Dormibacteria bacterium]